LHRGQDPFEAVNHCQDHALALARAYAEAQLYASLADLVSRADSQVAELLRKVLDLYALSRLEADRGWFLEHGYFDVPRAKAVRRLVLRLCGELRPRALELVDSFGIPDALLGAPIAR
jgi:acyl-CoA oxidase